MILPYLLQGATLGVYAGAQPGPLQAFFLSASIDQGWRRTLPAAGAPLLSDGPIILTVLFLLSQLPDSFLTVLRIGGGVFILYLAVQTFRSIDKAPTTNATPTKGEGRSILQASLLNLLNPNPWIFWGFVGGPTLAEAWQTAPPLALAFVGGFFVVFITLNVGLIMLFGTVGRLDDRLRRGLLMVGGAALAGFGLFQIVSGAGLL